MGTTINPFGKEIVKVDTTFCGRPLTIETNRIAFQTSGAVTVRYGDTVVIGVATSGPAVEGLDYFPLSVDYEEKMYAAGKISGSRFIKREGKPSDAAILAGRLIDRPIRPLFPKGYHNELQCVAMVVSLDPELKPDIVAMIAISSALMLSGVPFEGPVGGVRVGLVEGKLVAFPTTSELKKSDLDLVVAGTDNAIMMVEAGANEVPDDVMVEALETAHKAIQPVIAAQRDLAKKVGVKPQEYDLVLPDPEKAEKVEAFLKDKLADGARSADMDERRAKIEALEDLVLEEFAKDEEDGNVRHEWKEAVDKALKKEVRRAILEENVRPDNRKPSEIRPLSSEVGVLPRTHGSSLFTRGVTQALNVTTLAPLNFAMMVDTMEEETERTFIHHYNMPGWASGEVKRLGSPGRREIGHGALAERSLTPVIPNIEEFPYTIRTVTEILSANGSTSMASVCSGCLSLMDAGVPIKSPVSGIAMGLVTDGDKAVVLSDIQGAEDFAGDMDFKVAGTSKGINALQMDIKVHGISLEVMRKAIEQANEGRAFILKHMLGTLAEPRKQISKYAPQIEKLQINPDKIKDVIGKGGETINKIIAETGAEIDIRDGGLVMVAAPDMSAINKAIDWIKALTEEPEVGKVYNNARVVKIMDFGVFVEIMPGREGLVHVSEMADKRVEHPADMVKEGDTVNVKLVAIDDRGRLVLSMKQAK
ncbi:MAG TPA: polyribonucleotide nucleotidyltransferase [Candidatus Saccharimonadales bacterium]|nr:polyribonucleotide nucleotidyltransferase [Candidatus Saccharimonadales bacterium]